MHKAKSLWERHFWIIYNVNISDNWEIEFALLNSVRHWSATALVAGDENSEMGDLAF